MVLEAAEKKLHDAATKGDQLLQEDPYLLHGASFAVSRNLLHVATIWGQPAIVEEALRINPELAQGLDSRKSSALHIAAAKGDLRITRKLIRVAPEMCWWSDLQGMSPVHVAAMNGHVEILQELIVLASFPAMENFNL